MKHQDYKRFSENRNDEQKELLSQMATDEFWDQDGHQSISFFGTLKKIFTK